VIPFKNPGINEMSALYFDYQTASKMSKLHSRISEKATENKDKWQTASFVLNPIHPKPDRPAINLFLMFF